MANTAPTASRMRAAMKTDFIAGLNAAVEAQGVAINDAARVLAKTLGFYQKVNPQLFIDAHNDVGRAALRSLQQGYRSRRYRRPAGQYRAGQDRLSGTLGKALASTSHIYATPNALFFLDTGLLDREAEHWRRLNFGAGAGSKEGITPPQQFPITFGGLLVGTLGLPTQPSPAFRIPRGYWIGPEGRVGADPSRLGRDQFWLVGQIGGTDIRGRPSRGVQTAGIASRNFIDAAVRRIANELPRSYENIYDHLYRNARKSLQYSAEFQGVRLVKPSGTLAGRTFYRRSASRGAI